MISHKHKFIFIHMPKTGGNSIQNILINYSENKMVLSKAASPFHVNGNTYFNRFGITSNDEKFNIIKHSKLDFYYTNWRKKYGNIEDFFKFGTVRNPWELSISHFFYAHKRFQFNKKTFINSLHGYSCVDHFFVKKYGQCKLDYIIRFENLQQDFNIVCDKIGIPRQKLPHANKSKHKHYTEYYDDETREIVANKFAKDIEYFGYEFGK